MSRKGLLTLLPSRVQMAKVGVIFLVMMVYMFLVEYIVSGLTCDKSVGIGLVCLCLFSGSFVIGGLVFSRMLKLLFFV